MIKNSLKEIANYQFKNFNEAVKVMSYVEPHLSSKMGITIKELKDIIANITGKTVEIYEEDSDYYFTSISQLSAALLCAVNPTTEDDAAWHLEKTED